jgi:pilus assembly protein CpaC
MQVMLKVRVAEISRTALRRMGADLDVNWGDFSFTSTLGLGGAVSAVLDTEDVRLTLEAIASNSYAKILAEPNLVTLSGHAARFIAGGEFAVPVVVGVEGAAAATTNFRGFGTQLVFLPTVLDKDRIRLQVAPSFSSVNRENEVDGIPGLDTRAVATTVDLREGQWLAIAGLIQDQQEGSKERVPFVGDVPYLDSIFSRKRVQREESELLVLVSPELVHPLEAEEMPLILPGMEVTEPTNWQFFFAGRYEGRPDCDHRSTVSPILCRETLDARHQARKMHSRYQKCERHYVIGEHGFSQ